MKKESIICFRATDDIPGYIEDIRKYFEKITGEKMSNSEIARTSIWFRWTELPKEYRSDLNDL